ncbi:MAG: glycosyltransferase [Acidobacteria bacterium]|nr:glycosyltransferase [Acidobacteriota bacterium]
MQPSRATIVIPTLHGGEPLRRCLEGLSAQTCRQATVVLVDNSPHGVADGLTCSLPFEVIVNPRNVGFGEAINQGFAARPAEFLLSLNDDAEPAPDWLERLLEAMDRNPSAGMAASSIRLAGSAGLLDSAGMALYPDGTAKQRGHGEPAERYRDSAEALFPSGAAALYRAAMLERSGLFDPEYFLYCEDTDLGLRGRLAGWGCLYVPEAVVEHAYSVSAGRASRLKAFYVERNRLWTLAKLFPARMLWAVPFWSAWRYWAHLLAALQGRGLAGEIRQAQTGWLDLGIIVVSAHWRTLLHLPALWKQRRAFRRNRRLSTREFLRLLSRHRVSARQIAEQ